MPLQYENSRRDSRPADSSGCHQPARQVKSRMWHPTMCARSLHSDSGLHGLPVSWDHAAMAVRHLSTVEGAVCRASAMSLGAGYPAVTVSFPGLSAC